MKASSDIIGLCPGPSMPKLKSPSPASLRSTFSSMVSPGWIFFSGLTGMHFTPAGLNTGIV